MKIYFFTLFTTALLPVLFSAQRAHAETNTLDDYSPETVLRCEYQSGYGDATYSIGYDFNLQSGNFENLRDRSVGKLERDGNGYSFIEASGKGSIQFDNGYAILTHSFMQRTDKFVLKCKNLDPETPRVEQRSFALFSEDPIDGEIKPTLEFSNYCGNETAILKLDLSSYTHEPSPAVYSLYAERSQFGDAIDCLSGERRRENFKVLNQLLNEARSNQNQLNGQIQIRRQKFAPAGYAIKVEIRSERLDRTFVFRDNLAAKYEQ